MKAHCDEPRKIVIIGGGVSGALAAYHLVRQEIHARVIVIDPRPELGLGLAYSTPSMRHLLNVPAGKISALPDDPGHFLKWLRANYDSKATSATFAPRAVFGSYVRSLLSRTEAVEHIRASVVDCRLDGSGAILVLDNAGTLSADLVVLATGNFAPASLPGVNEETNNSSVYSHDAWKPTAYEGLPEDASVTLIGTGLTSVDVLLRLRELGHRGPVTAVSRHGVFPARHAMYTQMVCSAIPANTPATCLAYLRELRIAIRDGADWRGAVDSLRAVTNGLWLALSIKEQKRFRRHLQRRWDVARHRMAPQIANTLAAELSAGTLLVRKGHLESVQVAENGAQVTIRLTDSLQTFVTSRVINCTGPGMNYRKADSPLLTNLFAHGLVSPGPLGGGFNCSPAGEMIDEDKQVSSLFFCLGPGRQGTLLESIAIPEIRQQAVELAALLARRAQESENADERLNIESLPRQSAGLEFPLESAH